MPASVNYHPLLIEALKQPKEAEAYVAVALEQGDPKMFLVALRNVAEARGGIGKVAAKSKLNRESLYRMLSKKGNPTLSSLTALLKTLGFRLAIESAAPKPATAPCDLHPHNRRRLFARASPVRTLRIPAIRIDASRPSDLRQPST